jgi:hypothetical protein
VGIAMEDVGIVYFTAIWYILWPFGIFSAYLDFFPFWYVLARKIWQP